MADLSVKSAKKKKRKVASSEQKQRPSKTHRVDFSEKEREPIQVEEGENSNQREPNSELEVGRSWRNLQLILSIQNKEIDLQKKVELAFNFVKSRAKGGNDSDEDYQTVKISRLVVFLNDWIQSLLISLDKKIKVDGEKPWSGVIEACLDFRCWEVFKFCLEESLKFHVSLNFSRNLLRAICCIARNVFSLLNDAPLCSKESPFVGEGCELYIIVLDCVSMVFSSFGGLSNENLDLWVLAVEAVLELVHKIYSENLEVSNAGVFVLQFSCLVLEPFAKFLRVHPTRKNGFHDFVDKLLESLLLLLGMLQLRIDGCNPGWTTNLLKLVEQVLSQGLFHSAHIDGFLGLHSTEKYVASRDGKSKDSKTVIKSYHRHLFDKLERIVAAKKVLVLSGVGELFHLLVDRVKKHKGASVLSQDTKMIGKTKGSRHFEDDLSGHMSSFGSSSAQSEKNYCSNTLNAETRKSLFDFFVQIMEPLLLEMNGYVQAKLEMGQVLMDVQCTLKSINHLLASFMHEKVYVRTEDISEGACLNFLKKVYVTVVSFASDLLMSSKFETDTQKEMFTLLAKEVLVAVGYFLNIEYEVIQNDLVSLWLMMFSYLAIGFSFVDALEQCSLNFQILDLGCQLVNLYSDLRQVNNTIFSLCKAVRHILSRDDDGERNFTRFLSCAASLPYEAYAKSVGMLLCSQEFKISIHNAIKSIPEGQLSGCIRQLKVDVLESMEWMKVSCPVDDGKEFGKSNIRSCGSFDLQAELLGRGLSEVYALVLDSLTVTTGNSNLLGLSIKDLMTVICPCISRLVGLRPDNVNEFLFSVTGRNFGNRMVGNKNDLLRFGVSTHWVFVFFFRLHMSCRSLYRQALSLMPPDTSKKMSAVLGDSFTAYSGRDWMERSDWTNEGYFSSIVQPSASLLDVIQSVSDIYLKDSLPDCCPLIYVLHAMALQRLVDLKRNINALEYKLQSNDNMVQIKSLDIADLSLYHKKGRKWKKCISVLKEEAAGLTDFMMGYLSLVANNQLSISTSNDASCENTCAQALHESDEWDLGVCSVNEKSLPTAIWWIVCQNTDIWCTHATTKKLKMFLSLLIHSSLSCVTSIFAGIGKHMINEAGQLKKVTIHQISSKLLRDTILYEHKFVRRHLASRFCRVLEKSVLPLFSEFAVGDVNLKSSPNWSEVLSALDNSSMVVSSEKHIRYDIVAVAKLISDKLPTEICKEQKAFPLTGKKFTACNSLLNLLCWMPTGCLSSKAHSLYATYILNLERLVVSSLLQCEGTLPLHNLYELFRIFVSCRRTLKHIIMASCEEKTKASHSSLITILSKDSFFVLWLIKSMFVVVGLQEALSEKFSSEVRDMIFSLMDHTSYVFLTLSKYQFSCASHFMIAEKPCKEQPDSGIAHEHNNLKKLAPCLDSSKDFEAWKSVFLVAESLKEQAQSLLISLKDALCNEKVGVSFNVVYLNKLSSIVSCFSGFMWGLASAMNHTDAKCSDHKAKLLRRKSEPVSKLNLCLSVFANFISYFLHMLVVEDNQQPGSSSDAQSFWKLDYSMDSFGSGYFSPKGSGAKDDISCGKQHQKSGASMTCSASSDIDDDLGNASSHRNRLQLEDANYSASSLNEDDSVGHPCLNRHLLQRMLKGDHPEAAFSLRQLLIASSAILRLNLQINNTPLSSSLVPIFIGISQVLLFELANTVEVLHPFSFVWLDGVLKYLEELGSHFPLTNPTLTRNVYAKLVDLHLGALGKCISLQGKKATLASHEIESSAKILHNHVGLSEASLSSGPYHLDELKTRLRISFIVFIKKPSELHLLSAIQAIERALVGIQECFTSIYEINTGSADGGKVSPIVAAGIDCLDLVLEYVAGRKRFGVVKRHIQNLIAGLFNIILHLQSPLIFYGKSISNKGDDGPDPGSVILMCVEVLTRVSLKHALFQIDSWHVGQSLRIPAALFQDFHQLRLSEAPVPSDNQNIDPVGSIKLCVVDWQFLINLFAACCRLLCTVLKHHKSECERCVAVLEESVRVLLHCLEMEEVQEGIICACSLRRIYEELRQQKDVFGRHCFRFLSNYIRVYSGYGSLKAGIRREIDEALKPGVHALIDACSADDLQYLHTTFGEGPCRNTLATLQHDYKQNFQYEGKI